MERREAGPGGPLGIDGYGPGFFRIGGVLRQGPVALLPEGTEPWRGPGDPGPFVARAGGIDLVLVGLGGEVAGLDPAFRAALEAVGIGVEAMVTPPACRTYNLLLAEGRRVAAGLLPV